MVLCNHTKDGRKLKRTCINCRVEINENCDDCDSWETRERCAICNRSKGHSQFGCKYMILVKQE